METDKRYFLVGLFIVLTTLAAMGFGMWISKDKGDTVLYRTRFAESVAGLTVGGAVKFRGVNVGTVEAITIDPVDTRLIRVDMRIQRDTPVKTNTIASLKPQGITGVVFVELNGGSPNAQNLVDATPEDQTPEIPSEASSISTIVNQLPDLLNKVSEIADHIKTLVNDENIASISATLKHMERITGKLVGQADKLDGMMDKGDAVLTDLSDLTRDTKQNAREFMQNLNESSHQLNETLLDVRKTSRNINRFTETIKDEPSSLIFPREEKGIPAP